VIARFSRLLVTGDTDGDVDIVDGLYNILFAYRYHPKASTEYAGPDDMGTVAKGINIYHCSPPCLYQ
jgi:hypothetical protein